MNAYETEAMQQLLEEAGYRIVPFAPGADVYVINTCSVTNIADRKSRQMLHRARKMNPEAVIVAAGCYVQTAADRSHLDVDADILIGNDKKKDLPAILAAFFTDREKTVNRYLLDMQHRCDYESLSISAAREHTRAFVKVQDGCDSFCSYCIIPYARGRIRSRDPEDALMETARLAESGVREIVLTGIHLSSYGKDAGSSIGLAELVEKVGGVKGIERIRLGSLEPKIVTPEFASKLRDVPQLCPHFHLSLQSGSDSVLKRMNRRYTAQEYEEACGCLRDHFTDPALTTDVIVGFPQESEEEFEETRAFLQKLCLYETHIFRYSPREGTPAKKMPGQIPESVKASRSETLISLGKKNRKAFEELWEDRPCEVLLEEQVRTDEGVFYTGYTREYIRVMIPADQAGPDRENTLLRGCFHMRDKSAPCIFSPVVLK